MLDLTGIDVPERPELKHLVVQAARSIENILALDQPHSLLLRLNWPGHRLGDDSDGLVGLDAEFGHATSTSDDAIKMGMLTAIDEIFRDVESGGADYGVVPVENSTEGVVGRTLDLMCQTPLSVCGEIRLRIRQNLRQEFALARWALELVELVEHPAEPQANPQLDVGQVYADH